MTKAVITVKLSNEGKPSAVAEQEFDLTRALPGEQLSPKASEALRAAAKTLGVEIPEIKIPKADA